MKITKQRLKQIIREELESVDEGVFSSRTKLATAEKNLGSVRKAEKLVKQFVGAYNAAQTDEERKMIRSKIEALLSLVSQISEGSREDMMMPAISMADMEAAMADDSAGLGDLQSDEKFAGGSPEERLLTLIKARELLAAMGKEELTALSKSLDAEQVAVLRHILANPMYAPMGGHGDEMELEENITPGVQQLMKHHPHAAAKIKELAGNGYRASEIKRMLQLR